METNSVLGQKKASILHRWFALTLDGYSSGAADFFGKETDSFANPVGSTLLDGLKILLSYLVDGADPGKLSEASEALENIVKIRAVQDFSPSQALSFIFLLKKAVRLELKDDIILDARARERFLGETEPLDKKAGHIPGSVNRYMQLNLTDKGKFKEPATLCGEFEAFLRETTAEAIVHSCGSGVTACQNLFAMELAGMGTGRLYPGSWSEWIQDPLRPTEKGQ